MLGVTSQQPTQTADKAQLQQKIRLLIEATTTTVTLDYIILIRDIMMLL